jgi:hypothetical protein
MKTTDDLFSTYIHGAGDAEQQRLEAQAKLLDGAYKFTFCQDCGSSFHNGGPWI